MGVEVGTRRPRSRVVQAIRRNHEVRLWGSHCRVARRGGTRTPVVGCGSDKMREVDGKPAATPSPLDFGVVALAQRHDAVIELENRGEAPLALLAIESVGQSGSEFTISRFPPSGSPRGRESPWPSPFSPRRSGPTAARCG